MNQKFNVRTHEKCAPILPLLEQPANSCVVWKEHFRTNRTDTTIWVLIGPIMAFALKFNSAFSNWAIRQVSMPFLLQLNYTCTPQNWKKRYVEAQSTSYTLWTLYINALWWIRIMYSVGYRNVCGNKTNPNWHSHFEESMQTLIIAVNLYHQVDRI